MATVNKDFKIKSGLVVEGSSATVGGYDVLTKKQDDQDYIVGLIGGTATSANTANTVVKRDASGNFAAGTITATVTGTVSSLSNHDTADLAENATNKYFTDARAISATAASYDVIGAAAAAKTAAEATASADATSKANAAKTAAEATAAADATSKANAAQSAAISAAATDATTKANNAATAANSYTDTAISTEVSNRNSAITSAISTEVSNRNTAITNAVAAVVDAAPAALDTLNELAAALADSPDTVSNLTTLVGTKAPLASPALTGVPTAPTAAADTSTTQIATTAFAKAEADAAQAAAEATASADATSKANAAQSAATTAAATDATTKANAAQAAAISAAATDATTKANAAQSAATTAAATDATSKANAAQSAAEATASADATSKANAAKTGAEATAAAANTAQENGTTPFTALNINSVAKQVAATLSAPTAGVQTAYSWAKADFRSAEFLVRVGAGVNTEISKVLLTLDTADNIAITEYGVVSTNVALSTVSAAISGSNVELRVTTLNNTSVVTVMGTLIK